MTPAQTLFAAMGALLVTAGASAQPAGFPGATVRAEPREVSDQERARMSRKAGDNRSFEELFERARMVGRGEYLGVEPDIGSNIYRFKFMRSGGNVVWVDVDGRTGRVLAERR